jgi:UDP-glucose 4-epimerase
MLVTGSAGHLGEALTAHLRQAGHDVLGLDLLPGSEVDVQGSITRRELVAECMAGVSCVFHTATLHKPHVATHPPDQFVETNVTGTLILLEQAIAAGVRSFVFTSTTSTFGDAMLPGSGDQAVWVTEDLVPLPKNIYGVT